MTLDNIVFGEAMARRTFGNVERFVVFCARSHSAKVRVLSRLILGRNAKVRTVHRPASLVTYVCEPISLLLQSAAAVIPPFRRAVRRGATLMKVLRYGAFFTSVSQ